MQRFLDEWAMFDPDYRRTSKLLGIFVSWNLGVIGVSLLGFAFVHRLAWSPVLSTAGVWFLALGTVAATLIMLIGTGPGSLWRQGQPPTFTREELAEKRRLVLEIEDDLGRGHVLTQLARGAHAVGLRECRRHEGWLRRQLGPPEPQ
jgi:hypothetical protein